MSLDDNNNDLNLTLPLGVSTNMAILDAHTATFVSTAVIDLKKCLYLRAEVYIPLEADSAILTPLVDNGHKHSVVM